MATAEVPPRAHVRSGRRRPFTSWVKRLANLKGSSTDSGTIRWSHKRHDSPKSKRNSTKNNPYPLSGFTNAAGEYSSDFTTSVSDTYEANDRRSSSQSAPSLAGSGYDHRVPATSAKSTAPTISTNGDTAISEAAYSKAGTMATAGGAISSNGGGEGSTFSSPAPSVRSLATTLTTVQSAAPSTHFYNVQNTHHNLAHANSTHSTTNQQVQFSQPFPTSPATAVPLHLAPHGHSHTYSSATANNMLTDNASILTLASSSKRRRRNSLDTNASIRALAPSSVFGGSRESLPLSVLSANVADSSNASTFNAPGVLNRPSMVGLASVERISVYSATGTADRASYHNKANTGAGDGASIKSAAYSHGRNDSYAASISGGMGSVLPTQALTGRVSRRSSGWGEINGDESEPDKEEKDDRPGELKEEEDLDDSQTEGATKSTTESTTTMKTL